MGIQKELFNELNAAFDGDIDNIKLSAFIHEVLRIYPPAVAAGFRESIKDGFKYNIGDKMYEMPKGTFFFMNTMMLHHTPKHWVKGYDESNKAHREIDMKQIHFDFWLDADGNFERNALSFMTFSRGRRDCVGQSLAMKELYIVLAMIFMKYEVFGPNGDDKFEIDTSISLVMEPSPDAITLKLRC